MPCPACGAVSTLEIFPALIRTHPAGEGSEGTIASGETPCFQHPLRPAVVPCDRCGRLLCRLCDLPLGPEHVCPQCFNAAREGRQGPAPASRSLVGRSAFLLACLPMFPVASVAALILGILAWNHPGSLVRPRRWQARAAVALATLQLAAFVLVVAASLRRA